MFDHNQEPDVSALPDAVTFESSPSEPIARVRGRHTAPGQPASPLAWLARQRDLWAASFRRTLNRRGDRRRSTLLVAFMAVTLTVASADYTVRKGDTLSKIAAANGTTVSALVDTNGIANPDLIRIGQKLTIPGQDSGSGDSGEGGSGSKASSGKKYTVVKGDTLAKIAASNGTTVSAIVKANKISNPNFIRIGQELLLGATKVKSGSGGDTTDSGSKSDGKSDSATKPLQTHVVKKGETLASIAAKYDTTVDVIKAANGLTNSTIYIGTTLIVNGAAAPAVTAGSETGIHVVAAGETLGGIAAKYGVDLSDLAGLNGIQDINRIRIGMELKVPGASTAWVCPVAGARYFNDWGFPRSGGRFHQGNDLFAPRGTPVRAPVSGTVEFKTGVIGGLQFWFVGDDGIRYIGTHLDGFGIAGNVKAGDVIGYVGDSGNARGSNPHLHFEMARDGQTFNPYPTLQANGC